MRMRTTHTWMAIALALALCGALAMSGCQASPVKGGDIVGRWAPTKLAGATQAVPGTFIDFGGDGRASGFSGVNSFAGPYVAEPTKGSLNIGPLAGTQMAGPPAAMTGEQAFLTTLTKVAYYTAAEGTLTMYDDKNEVVAEFETAKTASLTGTDWVMTGHNNGKEAVVSSAISGNVTATFGTDGTVTGKSGCGTYSATYKTEGQTIEISKPKGTKTAPCPVDYDAQRTEYFDALPKAVTYAISTKPAAGGSVDTLELRDENGALLVSYEATPAK